MSAEVGVTAFGAILRRDRLVIGTALAVIALLAWGYVLWLSAHMAMPSGAAPAGDVSAMDGPAAGGMAGMDMGAMVAPKFEPLDAPGFVFIFAMWAVMMVGMMTPSVTPMVLLYANVSRRMERTGVPFASTAWFFAGYILVWLAFSLLATAVQWALTQLALLTPMMATSSSVVGGLVLIAAGLYQWTPLKTTCLRQCQSPFGFLMSHGGFRSNPPGALALGAEHGAYCLGCCWALMALLFVGGVMNVLWIAGLAILILLEKLVPAGRLIPRLSGAAIVAAGIWSIVSVV